MPRAAGSVSSVAAQSLLGGIEPPLEIGLSGLGGATLLLVGVLGAAGLAAMFLSSRGAATITWDCGYALPTPRMQYTASSFAQILGRLFRRVLNANVDGPSLGSLFPSEDARFESHVPDPVLDRVILPAVDHGRRGFEIARVFQTGHIQLYLVYIVVTLVALLAWSSAQ